MGRKGENRDRSPSRRTENGTLAWVVWFAGPLVLGVAILAGILLVRPLREQNVAAMKHLSWTKGRAL